MGMVQEFQEFIEQGNAMDMAVGVIIGGAFTGIVGALTDDIINPLIKFVTGGNSMDVSGLVIPGTEIDLGAFISACINFLIIALVVFLFVKGMNTAREKAAALASLAADKTGLGGKDGEPEEEKPAPTCPHCLEEVKEGATRCPHCAGEIAAA